MGDFLLCSRRAEDLSGERLARAACDVAERQGFIARRLSPLVWMITWGPRPPKVSRIGPWTLFGDVFDRRRPVFPSIDDRDPRAYDAKMIARIWGRYVGVLLDPSGAATAILRDPSGAREAVYWTAHGLTFVASDVPDGLVTSVAPDWRISTERLSAAIRNPLALSACLLLDGPVALLPGEMRDLVAEETIPLWSPADHVHRRDLTSLSTPDAADHLRAAVAEAVDGLASAAEGVGAEISGGLDSSIVAAALHPRHKVRLWLNASGPGPGADESAFVAALEKQLDIDVTRFNRRAAALDRDALEAAPQRLRPSLAALDGDFDQEWAIRCSSAGVDALFTGKGGDGMLIQPAAARVFTDLWRLKGWRALCSRDLVRLARLNERSVWTLVSEAIRWKQPLYPASGDLNLFTPSVSPSPHHPWLDDAAAWGPAKAVQVMSLLQGHGLHGPSRLTAAVDVFHPLLSQPVIEACLGLTTPQLTLGRRDRALARLAFRDRLPPAVLQRRSKGELTAYFGRMIADGLPDLRPWLLDGRLAALGVIDRRSAEAALTRDALIRCGDYPDILLAAMFEGWVRAWDNRLQV